MAKIRQELYYGLQSNYSKPSNTTMPVDEVEQWLNKFPSKRAENKANGGIIQSTASIIFTDNASTKISKKEHNAKRSQARREHKKAIKNLEQQNALDAKAIKKQQIIWRAEIRKGSKKKLESSKEKYNKTRRAKRAAERPAKPNPVKKTVSATLEASRKKRAEAIVRRAGMVKLLQSGSTIKSIDWKGDSLADHQQQSNDLSFIAEKHDLKIIRINQLKTRTMGFRLDVFTRYDAEKPISCLLNSGDGKELLAAVRSGKVMMPKHFHESVTKIARTMTIIAREYGLNVHSIIKSNKTLGWVLIDE